MRLELVAAYLGLIILTLAVPFSLAAGTLRLLSYVPRWTVNSVRYWVGHVQTLEAAMELKKFIDEMRAISPRHRQAMRAAAMQSYSDN